MKAKNVLFMLIICALAISGCGKEATVDDEPEVEVLTLSEECRQATAQEKEECCINECRKYCNEIGYVMEKVETLTTNCGCWCS